MEQLSESELWQLKIIPLRAYARAIGVRSSTSKKKSVLIKDILAIYNGTLTPHKASRGRPPIHVL